MKFFILSASALIVFLGLSSCEKHDWNDTKKIFQSKDDEKKHDDHAEEKH